jgi:hypothetical protein
MKLLLPTAVSTSARQLTSEEHDAFRRRLGDIAISCFDGQRFRLSATASGDATLRAGCNVRQLLALRAVLRRAVSQ